LEQILGFEVCLIDLEQRERKTPQHIPHFLCTIFFKILIGTTFSLLTFLDCLDCSERVEQEEDAGTEHIFYLVPVEQVLHWKEIPRNEDVVDKLAQFHSLNDFPCEGVTFVSHRWMTLCHPDVVGGVKLKALQAYVRVTQSRFIWIDYTCIPQKDLQLKLFHINRLHELASRSENVLIIASTTREISGLTITEDNLEGYLRRGWCALEYGMFIDRPESIRMADLSTFYDCETNSLNTWMDLYTLETNGSESSLRQTRNQKICGNIKEFCQQLTTVVQKRKRRTFRKRWEVTVSYDFDVVWSVLQANRDKFKKNFEPEIIPDESGTAFDTKMAWGVEKRDLNLLMTEQLPDSFPDEEKDYLRPSVEIHEVPWGQKTDIWES